jgi:hypothetical protein
MYLILVVGLLAAEDAKAVKPTATAAWTYSRADVNAKNDAKQLAIRSGAELVKAAPSYAALKDVKADVLEKQATEALAKALKVKAIDWKKEMLLVITAGTKRTGGYKVAVTDVKVAGDTMTVTYKVTPPDGFATQAFTHPGAVALVPAHKGKVVFEQAK